MVLFYYLCKKATSMDENDQNNKQNLEEPAANYGKKVTLGEIEFQPVPHMMETLQAQGCISFEDFVEKFSKYL